MRSSQLDFKAGGGVLLTIFGLPFFLAGLGVLYAGFNGSLTMEGGGPAQMSFYVPFGGVFAAAGLGVISGAPVADWIEIWELSQVGGASFFYLLAGLRVPWTSLRRSLFEKRSFEVKTRVERFIEPTLPVRRTLTSQPCPFSRPRHLLMVDTQSNYLDGRRECERVAKFLQYPMRDTASGSEQLRQPDELDISLRDLWKKEGKEPVLVAQPSSGRVALSMESDRAVFEIPASGFGLLHATTILGAGIMLIFVSSFFGFSAIKGVGAAPGPFKFVWFGFGLLFVLPILSAIASATKSALSRDRLTVSNEDLILERRSPIGGSTVKIPLKQLEELELVNGFGALEARSDHAAIRVGAGLGTEEVAWVKSMLEYIIVKGDT